MHMGKSASFSFVFGVHFAYLVGYAGILEHMLSSSSGTARMWVGFLLSAFDVAWEYATSVSTRAAANTLTVYMVFESHTSIALLELYSESV